MKKKVGFFSQKKKEFAMEREDVEDKGDKGVNPSARRSNWVSWLIPIIVLANIAVFVVEMYVNNCPKRIRNRANSFEDDDDKCVARFLGRFSFQPLSENPLFGPSSAA